MSAHTVEDFLAKGGQITQLDAAPIQKINTGNIQNQIVAMLQTGAKTIDELAEKIGNQNMVLNAYKTMRKHGISIIMREGWLALDQADLNEKTITIQDQCKREYQLNERQISFAIGNITSAASTL